MHPSKLQLAEQNRRWKALYQAIAALNETLDPQRVLEIALEVSAAVLSSRGERPELLIRAALLFREDPDRPRELRISAMRGFSPEDCAVDLTGAAGLIGQVIQEGKPSISRGAERDPDLSRLASIRSAGEIYCIPLGKSIPDGVLLYGHPDPGYFSADRRQILDLLARQTSTALSNARRLREYQLQVERILDLQDMNRKQLARELHDGPTQSVAALAMRVNIARRLAARESQHVVAELAKIESIARQATSELRHVLFQLNPQVLESQGLAPALQALGDKFSQAHGQRVVVQVEPEIVTRLEMGKQTAIFDLVDQALRATCRKEELENIWVRLQSDSQGRALLEIEDDGLAVSATGGSTADPAETWMDAIREQVDLLEGVYEASSSGGHGSCLRITIPLGSEPDGHLAERS